MKAAEEKLSELKYNIENCTAQIQEKECALDSLTTKLQFAQSQNMLTQKDIEDQGIKTADANKVLHVYKTEEEDQKKACEEESSKKILISSEIKKIEMDSLAKDKELINLKKEIGLLKSKKESYIAE